MNLLGFAVVVVLGFFVVSTIAGNIIPGTVDDSSNAPSPVPTFTASVPTSNAPTTITSNAPTITSSAPTITSNAPTITSSAPTLAPVLPNVCQVGSDIDGEASENRFGLAVSMSSDGSRIAVGWKDDASDVDGWFNRFQVFEWQDDDWVPVGSVVDTGDSEEHASAVALSDDGNQIAVGSASWWAPARVRVFKWLDDEWVQVGSNIDGGPAAGGYSGWQVVTSSDGNQIAVGARFTASLTSGRVRVFQLQNDEWIQVGSDIEGETDSDVIGHSVSMSSGGNRITAGIYTDPSPHHGTGRVRVFDWQDGEWVQVGSDIDGEAAGDFFGEIIAISGDGSRIASGARRNDGAVRVFEWQDNQWIQVGSSIAGDGQFTSVAISGDGNLLVVGSLSNVRVFQWRDDEWIQVGSDIDGEAVGDNFGARIAISGDGSHIVVGGYLNDGNGSNSGHVRVFSLFGMC